MKEQKTDFNEIVRQKYLRSLSPEKKQIAEKPIKEKMEMLKQLVDEGKIMNPIGMAYFSILHNLEDCF